MKYWPVIIFAFLTLSCTTHPYEEGRSEYIALIDKYSAGDKQFSGLYHQFEYRATLLNRKVSQAIHDRLKLYYAWSEEEAEQKLQERMEKLNNQTLFWLSFFTGERKNDNLSHKNSIWKIYLETPSGRYEGRAYKTNMNFSEAQSIIPYHNRWSSSYYLEFPVATDQVQYDKLKLIITGPLGRREVQFPQI